MGKPQFEASAKSGFAIAGDAGLVVVDTWDEELEEPKPRQATKLCGAQASDYAARMALDALSRLDQVVCEANRCVHPAAEAIDYRGEYRFVGGELALIVLTSGPPAHVMQEVIDAELAFAERAAETLADAPCGDVLTMD